MGTAEAVGSRLILDSREPFPTEFISHSKSVADTKFWQHVGEVAAVADGWLLESRSYFKICLVDPNKSMPTDSEDWWPVAAEVPVSSKWLLESKELFWTMENASRQEHGHKTKKKKTMVTHGNNSVFRRWMAFGIKDPF